MAAEGASLFADNCAACHGENAKGDREIVAWWSHKRWWRRQDLNLRPRAYESLALPG